MTPARDSVLLEAERYAAWLRADGYPNAEVAPQYCIGNEIAGGMFTRTVVVWVGERDEARARRPFRRIRDSFKRA